MLQVSQDKTFLRGPPRALHSGPNREMPLCPPSSPARNWIWQHSPGPRLNCSVAERPGRLHAEQDVSGSVRRLWLPLPGPSSALPSFLKEGRWCSPSLGGQGSESQDVLCSSEAGFAASSFCAPVRFPSHICTWGALQQSPRFSPLSPALSDSAHRCSR